MKYFIKFIGKVILFLIMLSCFAYSTGVNVTFNENSTVKDHANSSLLKNTSVVQFIRGGSQPPDPAVNSFVHGNAVVFDSFHVTDGTQADGTFARNNATEIGAVYLRIWENGGPAANSNYCNVAGNGSPAENPLPNNLTIGNIFTNFKAAAPAPPTASANGYKFTFDDQMQDYVLAFNLNLSPNKFDDGTIAEVVKGAITVTRKKDGQRKENLDIGEQKETNADPAARFWVPGETYQAQGLAYNYFGWSAAGAVAEFTIPNVKGVVGGLPVKFSFDLKKGERDKLIVNAVSSPKDIKAADLAALINAKAGAGKQVVVAIGKWDAAASASKAYIPGSNAPDNFDIKAGEGVQIYLSEDVAGLELLSQ